MLAESWSTFGMSYINVLSCSETVKNLFIYNRRPFLYGILVFRIVLSEVRPKSQICIFFQFLKYHFYSSNVKLHHKYFDHNRTYVVKKNKKKTTNPFIKYEPSTSHKYNLVQATKVVLCIFKDNEISSLRYWFLTQTFCS